MKVYRHPGRPPDADSDDPGESQADIRQSDFPIQGDRSRYLMPLEVSGTPDSPDQFDIIDRLPYEFAGDSPETADKRAARIESDLAAAYDSLTLITDSDRPSTDEGEEQS